MTETRRSPGNDEPASLRKRPGGRTARTGAAVVAATLELLAESGLGSLSIEEVADRAGVHKTTVYRRWGTRERLVGEALATLGATKIPIPDTGTLRGDVEAMAHDVSANLATPLGRAVAQTMVGSGDDPEIARITAEFWSTRFDLTSVLIERAIHRGELPEHTDTTFAIEMVVATVWFRSIVTRAPISDELITSVVDVVIAGFSPDGST